MKSKALFLLPLVLLMSCGKDRVNSYNKSKEIGQVKEATSSYGVVRREIDITSSKDLDDHQFVRNYLSSFNHRTIEIKLSNEQTLGADCFANSKETRVTTLKKNNELLEVSVKIGNKVTEKVIVTCPILEDSKLELRNFEIHPDLILSNETNQPIRSQANSDKYYDHVYIGPGVTFIYNYYLTINAKKLIFHDSVIRTFPSNQYKASNDEHGMSGGYFVFNTNEILGNVEFELYGQMGGDVTTRPPQVYTIIPEDPALNGDCRKDCKGKPGKQGLKGLKGHEGKRGGNSGSFFMQFNKSLGFELFYTSRGAIGSLGGRGGIGGPGQLGGIHQRPSRGSDPLNGCRPNCIKIPFEAMKVSRAESGPQGEEGDRGESGQTGRVVPSQVIYKTKSEYLESVGHLRFESEK